jgi:hypothetical protein
MIALKLLQVLLAQKDSKIVEKVTASLLFVFKKIYV